MTARQTNATPTLSESLLSRLRAAVKAKGAKRFAAEIGCTREALLAALAGQPIRNGSIALLRQWHDKTERNRAGA